MIYTVARLRYRTTIGSVKALAPRFFHGKNGKA